MNRHPAITTGILLAERCPKGRANVLRNDGKPFNAASIGSAIATRAIMEDVCAGMDSVGGGPGSSARPTARIFSKRSTGCWWGWGGDGR